MIPTSDTGVFQDEMNRFLRSQKIMEVSHQLVSTENGASWCFCVKYIDAAVQSSFGSNSGAKVDYRQVLDAETFKIFSRLREIRKAIAADEGVPAFAVFVDEELAELAKLPEITPKAMLSIKGIGDKKVERFAEKISMLKQKN